MEENEAEGEGEGEGGSEGEDEGGRGDEGMGVTACDEEFGLRCHDDASRRIPPGPVDHGRIVDNSPTRTRSSAPPRPAAAPRRRVALRCRARR
ncbi:hypothetical protein GCM10010345_24340 [Streptomyces canarius]|uniref:Uncharacterized protein n=1 Tax=Streptomyces canarius TaxID=285453 RepID=A0ABQ3CJ02_9ACTN|nr:hypothetical protein GCM10010345_24340 [Streptomyces canarius]